METPVLKNKDIFPTAQVIENFLGESFPVYQELTELITNPEFGLIPEWNYYNDGKA